MTIKLLGGCLVVLSGALVCLFSARLEKKRLAFLDAWITLLVHIRTQIDCYLMTLDAILATAPQSLLSEGQQSGEAPSLERFLAYSAPYLDAEALRLLDAFVKEVGGSYREEQLRRCEYYLASLRALRGEIASALPAKTKVTRALCLCLSVGTAILLW